MTGDVVNTAARIQSAAPVGGVAVGEQTYRATSRVFEYDPLEPAWVKGKPEPLVLWEARAARARFGTDITRQYTTPLVGRELEKPLLIGTFERAAQQRSVQLVTLVGEPGVGKSRLVAELFSYLGDEAGADSLAAGALSAVWGGDHVLGVGRDRQGGGRHPGVRLGGGCRCEAGGGGLPGGAGAAVAITAAGAAGRGGGGLAGGAAGVVRGLAALPGGAGGGPARPCSCSRTCTGRTRPCSRSWSIWPSGRGGAAAPPVHGAAGAARATPGLGGRDAKRDDDQPSAALGAGNGRARRPPDHHHRSQPRARARRARAGRWQPAVCGGVRAPARRPRPGCRRDGVAGERAGADCRSPGHALARSARACSRTRPCSERCSGWVPWPRSAAATRASSSWRCTSLLAKSWSAPPGRARWKVRASTRSGICSCAMSPTGRSRGRSERAVIAPRPPGSSARPASGSRTWQRCSPTTTCRRSSSPRPPATGEQAEELALPARRFLALAGERALGLDTAQAEARLARALELTPGRGSGAAGAPRSAGRTPPTRPAACARQRRRSTRRSTSSAHEVRRKATARALLRSPASRPYLGEGRQFALAAEAVALLEQEPPGPTLIAAHAQLAVRALRSRRLRAKRSQPPTVRCALAETARPARAGPARSASGATPAPSSAMRTASPRWSGRSPCSSSRAQAETPPLCRTTSPSPATRSRGRLDR